MAIAIAPKIQVTISGDNICTTDQLKTWTLFQKQEQIKTIKNSDGLVTLDFDTIENMELLQFYSSGSFNLKLTVTVGGEAPSTNVLTIPITGFFILNTSQTFIDSLTTIQISTSSVTDITLYINAYGKEVSA
jgi:hypothetical protein